MSSASSRRLLLKTDPVAAASGIRHKLLAAETEAHYNQVIDGHRYLTQEEFSNRDFLKTHGGCIPSE